MSHSSETSLVSPEGGKRRVSLPQIENLANAVNFVERNYQSATRESNFTGAVAARMSSLQGDLNI